jgi:radical SAM superfamily enzyme YgiQ (UPF0313 family)
LKDLLLFCPLDDFAKAQYEYIPLGVLYLASFIEEAGYEVDVIHGRTEDIPPGYKHYGISAATAQYTMAVDALKHIRKIQHDAKVIAGGPHFKALTCINDAFNEDWDYIISGDGEYTLRNIVSCRLLNIERVTFASPIMNLDTLPMPAWGKIDIQRYNYPLRPGLKCVNLSTSRGCPWKCAYCSTSNTKLRECSPDRVLEEADILVNKYGFDSFMIADDNVSVNKKRFYGILDGFEKLGVKWRSLIRAETINDEGLERMLRSGCIEIGPGIESGSQKILDLVEKKSKVEDNIRFVKRCEEVGITCVPSFIIGLPNESSETVQETYEFMKIAKPSAFAWNMFLPLPDCPISLQYETKYKDYITLYPLTWDDCMTKAKKITQCFVSTPYLSREQILSEYYKYYDIFADLTGFDPRRRGTRGD